MKIMKLLTFGIVALLLLSATGSYGWNYDFNDGDEVTLIDGKTYIDTETGHLILSAPPAELQYGQEILFPSQDDGAILEETFSDGDYISLDSLDQFTEIFSTTQFYDTSVSENISWNTGDREVTLAKDLEWHPQDSGIEDIRLNDLDFVDEEEGWAIGGYGATSSIILRTLDGGDTWNEFTQNPVDKELTSIHFKNNFGVITGIEGTIIIIEGTSWRIVNPAPVPWNLFDAEIVFTTGNPIPEILVIGDYGTLLYSDNGGDTWEVLDISENDLKSIDRNGNDGNYWIVGSSGELMYNDGTDFSDWNTGSIQTTVDLYDIDFVGSTGIGWIAGDAGKVFRTTNDGNSWAGAAEGLIAPTESNLRDVTFPTPARGWVVGNAGVILMTENGDALNPQDITWEQQGGSFENLSKISFIDPDVGWICGDDGTILKSPRYSVEGTVQSQRLVESNNTIKGAILKIQHDYDPEIKDINYFIQSFNAEEQAWEWIPFGLTHIEGENWVSNYQELNVINGNLKWKAILNTSDPSTTPRIKRVEIDYNRGYQSPGYYTSPVLDFEMPDQQKHFTTIQWDSSIPEGGAIEVRYKIDDDDFSAPYSNGQIDIDEDGYEIQFRVKLTTPTRDLTPVLEDLTISYGFVEDGTAQSDPLVLPTITAWKNLIVNVDNLLPEDNHQVEIQVLNNNDNPIVDYNFYCSVGENIFDISELNPSEPQFRNLALKAILHSDNPFTTPQIDSWQLTSTISSTTQFVDFAGNAVNNFEIGDNACAEVKDSDQNMSPNLIETIEVMFYDPATKDTVYATISETGVNTGIFRGCVNTSDAAPDNNDSDLQTGDEHVIHVRYTDPDDPSDISQDSAVMDDGGGTNPNLFVAQPKFMNKLYDDIANTYQLEKNVDDFAYIQIEDDTLSMDPFNRTIEAVLYEVEDPTNQHPIVLNLFEPVPGSSIRAYFRSTESLEDLTPIFGLNEQGDTDTLIVKYTDINYGEDIAHQIKTAQVRIEPEDASVGGTEIDTFYVYPNPWKAGDANPKFKVKLRDRMGSIKLRVYNIAAEEVWKYNQRVTSKEFEFEWDLLNKAGKYVASGTYICVLEVNGDMDTTKLVVIQ